MKSSEVLARILAKWRVIAAVVGIFKVTLMVLIPPIPPPAGDIFNWAGVASLALGYVSQGHFPPISITGVYGLLGLVLVPFYWVWMMLPIAHPSMETVSLYPNSTPAVLLSILMKVPPFLSDLATGIIVSKLVRQLTRSEQKSRVAFLLWYANPFNIYWINVYGGMDVIPGMIFVFSLYYGMANKWYRCGVFAAIASLLRIFPILALPFFPSAIQSKRTRRYMYLFAGFLSPLALGLILMYATGAGTLITIAKIPEHQSWLLDFLGWNITNAYVKTALVVVAVQLFISYSYWRRPLLLHLATVSLLAFLLGAQAYGGSTHHFLWVSPLLAVSVALTPDELWIFTLTFVTASLAPPIFRLPPIRFIDTLQWGSFFAAKAAYLLKINLENIGFHD